MLEVDDPSLALVDGHPESISRVAFSPCSMFFLVSRQPEDANEGQSFKVFSRSRVCLATFDDDAVLSLPSVAFIPGNRIAIAHLGDFDVRSLSTGELLGSAGPDEDVGGIFKHGSSIAANPAGSQLAFCVAMFVFDPTHEVGAVHVFDAISLEPLATFHPPAKLRSVPDHGGPVDMVWSVHGWLLTHHGTNLCEVGHLQLLTPVSGRRKYRRRLWCERQPWQAPALSPCGTFCCMFDPVKGKIRVVDLRSGQTLLVHALGVAEEAHKLLNIWAAVNVWWSTCGRRLLVRVFAFDRRQLPEGCKWNHERIHVLQL